MRHARLPFEEAIATQAGCEQGYSMADTRERNADDEETQVRIWMR